MSQYPPVVAPAPRASAVRTDAFDRGPDLGDPPFDPGMPFDPAMPGDPFGATGGGGLFDAAPVLIGIVFALVIGTIVVRLLTAAQTHATNSALPRQTVAAKVVAKRTRTEGGQRDLPVRTRYFVTFEHADGERTELSVPGREHGRLAEGDEGTLTAQGTWYRGFERRRVIPLDGTWEAPGGPSLAPPDAT